MTFKYKNRDVEGKAWKRANSVTIYNDYNETPRVMFAEESIVEVDGEVLRRPVGELTLAIVEEAVTESFPILNPDGSDSGRTGTIGQISELLTSAYVHYANLRDQLHEEGKLEEPVDWEDLVAPQEH